MNSVNEEWKKFRRMVIPRDASDNQVMEMHKAFIAGMLVSSSVTNELLNAVGNGLISDEECEDLFKTHDKEIRNRVRGIANGITTMGDL